MDNIPTRTDLIKLNSCPFKNEAQGRYLRVLFVCSAGLLRSPTAAKVAGEFNINARAAGSLTQLALIPVSANLVVWADKLVFVNQENFEQTLEIFKEQPDFIEAIKNKSIVWNIEDYYDYNSRMLQTVLRDKIREELLPVNYETRIERDLYQGKTAWDL